METAKRPRKSDFYKQVQILKADVIMQHPLFYLCRRVQHIFYKNAISGGWVIYKDVGHRADKFAVLDDGRAGHADVK